MRLPLFIYRIIKYEYWAWWFFYLPLMPYWLFLAIKYRSLTFFTAANPAIYLGGFYGESKQDILSLINKKYVPQSIFVEQGLALQVLETRFKLALLQFPVVAKPDIGGRGESVSKIESMQQLFEYHHTITKAYIIQEFITYELELGIFYSRLPNASTGIVSSIVAKYFMQVIGDGKSTVEQLMQKQVRSRFQINRFKKENPQLLKQVIMLNETKVLEPIGNHCRGTAFINYNKYISPSVHQVFDEISKPITGFYYGRFDLKVKSINDLYAGENIKILELNGSSSEPGHIYDANYNLFKAYADVMSHWKRMAQISKQNILNGIKPVSFKLIIKNFVQHVINRPANS